MMMIRMMGVHFNGSEDGIDSDDGYDDYDNDNDDG